MSKLKELKHVGFTSNSSCGLLKGGNKRVVGCGKSGRLMSFTYKLNGYNLWSSLSLCQNCHDKQLEGE